MGLKSSMFSYRHLNLVSFICSPPNVFDGFVLSGSASHLSAGCREQSRSEAENKAQQAESKALRVLAHCRSIHAQALDAADLRYRRVQEHASLART